MKNTNKKITKIISLFILIFTIFIFNSHKVIAACDSNSSGTSCYQMLSPLPGLGDANNMVDTTNGIGDYIKMLIKLFFGVVGFLAVVMVVLGGIEYMTSGGAEEKSEGKGRIMNALFGLTLALSAWLILNTINPDLVTLKITIPKVIFTDISDDAPPPTQQTTLADGSTIETACAGRLVGGSIKFMTSDNDEGGSYTATKTAMADNSTWPNDNGGTIPLVGGITMYDRAISSYKNKANERAEFSSGDFKGITVSGSTCTKVQVLKVDPNNSDNYIDAKDGSAAISCVSLYGLPEDAINDLGRMKVICDTGGSTCAVNIIAGTECWLHGNGGPGEPVVRVSKNTSLDAFIKAVGYYHGDENPKYWSSGYGDFTISRSCTSSKYTLAGTGGYCSGTNDSTDPTPNHWEYVIDIPFKNNIHAIDEGNYWSIYNNK